MRITQTALPFIAFARGGGMNARVRGWNRALKRLFPIDHQAQGMLAATYRGQRYMAAPNHYVDWQVLTIGGYELDDIAVFEMLAARLDGAIVLDIGTNVGHHAFVFATLGWRVHAFEPNPELWPIIEAKIVGAEFSCITLHKVGLGDKDEVLVFRVPVETNSGTGHFIEFDSDPVEGQRTLPVKHGDRYLASQGVERVDVVKMDIQGFEPHALQGLRKTLIRDRPVVSVEIGDENRAAIPTLAALAAMLPSSYSFRAIGYHTGAFTRRARLGALEAERFVRFDGNLFCVPSERLELIERD